VILELFNTATVSPADCATPSAGSWYTARGGKWILGNYGNTLYNHFYAPNSDSWDCMNLPQQKGYLAARSLHPGGANVLACDGSLRFVEDGVDLTLWRTFATRAGSETTEGL
jgi:prepilin-type processing-associated H-X9-DG protein